MGSGVVLTPVPVSAPCVPPPLVALASVALASVLAVVVLAAPLLPLLPLALSELLPDPLVPHAASTATPTIHRAIIMRRIYAHKRRSGGRSIRLVCAVTGRRAKSRVEAQR